MKVEVVDESPELTADEKTWGMLAHVTAFSGFVVPLGNLLGPVVVGLVKKESVFVRGHAWESCNFQLTLLIHTAVLGGLLVFSLLGNELGFKAVLLVLTVLYGLTIGIGSVVLMVLGGIRGYQGQPFRYPLTIRFVNGGRMAP